MPGVGERAADEHPAVGREREDVRDHAAVGEDLGRVAERVDEGLVEPALVDERAHLVEERRPDVGEPRAHVREGLAAARPRSRTAGRAWRVPHRELPDEPGEQRAERGSQSMPSTEISTGASSCSSASVGARSSISPTSQTWCSTMRVNRSMPVTFLSAGTRRPPGGLKCTWLGAVEPEARRCRRQRDGARPKARANARVNASLLE